MNNPATDLYQKIKAGDEKAFNTFFLHSYSKFCCFAVQYVTLQDAEEIVQDLMVWLWKNKEILTIETSLENYLFAAIKNKCLTLINRNRLKQQLLLQISEETRSLFENPDFYIVEELSKKISTALAKLPDSYREAFEMNRFQNMTYQEIAQKLNISPKTVDYRICQALKLLRINLKEYLPLFLLLFP